MKGFFGPGLFKSFLGTFELDRIERANGNNFCFSGHLFDLGKDNDVIVAIFFGALRTGGEIKIDLLGFFIFLFKQLLSLFKPLGNVFKGAIKDEGFKGAGNSDVLCVGDFLSDVNIVL